MIWWRNYLLHTERKFKNWMSKDWRRNLKATLKTTYSYLSALQMIKSSSSNLTILYFFLFRFLKLENPNGTPTITKPQNLCPKSKISCLQVLTWTFWNPKCPLFRACFLPTMRKSASQSNLAIQMIYLNFRVMILQVRTRSHLRFP